MTSNGETGKVVGSNMDEEGSKREEVKGSPHASTQNNTAVGSGEERTPQVVRKLEL